MGQRPELCFHESLITISLGGFYIFLCFWNDLSYRVNFEKYAHCIFNMCFLENSLGKQTECSPVVGFIGGANETTPQVSSGLHRNPRYYFLIIELISIYSSHAWSSLTYKVFICDSRNHNIFLCLSIPCLIQAELYYLRTQVGNDEVFIQCRLQLTCF